MASGISGSSGWNGTRGVAAAVAGAAALAGGGVAWGQITPTWRDVPFATVPVAGGQTLTLRMNIYRPAGATGRTPLVVWIHGGGWQTGSYSLPLGTVMSPLLQRGVSVATVGYRLSGQAVFPAQIHDVKGAVRFLRANAGTYMIDPARVACAGPSAGGHLAALLAASGGEEGLEGDTGGNRGHTSSVLACVDYFGPTDILSMSLDVTTPPGTTVDHDAPTSGISRLIGFDEPGQGVGVLRANLNNPAPPFPELAALARDANPISFVGPDEVPFFIAHGDGDTTVPLRQSTRLRDALVAAGNAPVYRVVAGAGHGPLGFAVDSAARDFLVAALTACLADLNRDGEATFDDVLVFVRLFNAANHRADFTLDGELTFDDIAGFIARYNEGC